MFDSKQARLLVTVHSLAGNIAPLHITSGSTTWFFCVLKIKNFVFSVAGPVTDISHRCFKGVWIQSGHQLTHEETIHFWFLVFYPTTLWIYGILLSTQTVYVVSKSLPATYTILPYAFPNVWDPQELALCDDMISQKMGRVSEGFLPFELSKC